MKLQELFEKQELIKRMYEAVTEFDRVLEVLPVIDQIEKHLKALEKNRKGLLERVEKEPNQVEKEWQELLEKDVKLTLPKVTKEEVKKCGFNPFEYRKIQTWVK